MLVADGQEHALADLRGSVQSALKLSDVEIAEKFPSGPQSRFSNRLAWASVYFTIAGVLKRVRRGIFQITDRGRELFKENHARITVKLLSLP
jgi:restriction system protein